MRSRAAAIVVALCACLVPPSIASATPGVIVRPGVSAYGCTLDFIFLGSDGNRYAGTAGHCIVDDGNESTWNGDVGQAIDIPGAVIGHAAYAIWNQDDLNPLPDATNPALPLPADFALVRLSSDVTVDPSVCHFGGPTGINENTSDPAAVVHYYGSGSATRSTLPARTALATGFSDPRWLQLQGPIGPGDSGSPILDDAGRAVGILSHLGSPDGSSFAPVSRLQPHLERAEQALGIRLQLQTAATDASAVPFGSDAC